MPSWLHQWSDHREDDLWRSRILLVNLDLMQYLQMMRIQDGSPWLLASPTPNKGDPDDKNKWIESGLGLEGLGPYGIQMD